MSTFLQLQDRILNITGAQDQESRDLVKDFINETIYEIDQENPQASHLQKSAALTLTAGDRQVTLPSDYDHSLNIQLTVNGKLNPPLTFLSRREWNESAVENYANGIPKFYNIWDSVIELAPAPDQAYTTNLDYFCCQSALVNNSDTCKITDHYIQWEHVIIKGGLSKFYEYLASDKQLIDMSDRAYQRARDRFRAWVRRNADARPDASRLRTYKEINAIHNPIMAAVLRQG